MVPKKSVIETLISPVRIGRLHWLGLPLIALFDRLPFWRHVRGRKATTAGVAVDALCGLRLARENDSFGVQPFDCTTSVERLTVGDLTAMGTVVGIVF